MKRILLVLIFCLLSSNLLAKDRWEYITSSNDKITSIYIYSEKIIKEKEFANVWTLLDFSESDNYGNLSILILMKFDCKWYRVKNLKYSFHKKRMGRGPIKTSAPKNIEWHYIETYQINSMIFDRVCD